MPKPKDEWIVVYKTGSYAVLYSIVDSKEEGLDQTINPPYYGIFAVKIWPHAMINPLDSKGLVLTLDGGDFNSKEDCIKWAYNLWKEKEKQSWYGFLVKHINESIKNEKHKLPSLH